MPIGVTPIGKAEIARLIPHAGAMCLLDSVVRWDSQSITCLAASHRDANHPLAIDGRLDSVCGIEYAAQAMAIHGGLTSGRRPDAGYLASVRDVTCHAGRLDQSRDDLEVTARLLTTGAAGAIYSFLLRCGEVTILEGRAAVVIDAGPRSAVSA
jgi:predicted hotdog family 3-hydroxylacyl-ACP dehydratase